MKKSVYITYRTIYWSSRLGLDPFEVQPQVRQDLEAVEAAAVKWDEEVPYRIDIQPESIGYGYKWSLIAYNSQEDEEPKTIGYLTSKCGESSAQELLHRYNHFLSPKMYIKIKPEWIQSLNFIIIIGTTAGDPIRVSLLELLAWLQKGAGESR